MTSLESYVNELDKYPPLSKEETEALLKKKDKCQVSFDKLINHNLRFVMKVAYEYVRPGVDIMDLIAEGNIGLMHGLKRFEFGHGANLITYAVNWIRQKIMRFIAIHGKTIRLPVHVGSKRFQTKRFEEKFEIENGRAPSDEEIASGIDCNVKSISKARIADAQSAISMDVKMNFIDEESFANLIPCPRILPNEECGKKELLKIIADHLQELPPRTQEILRWRFGLDGYEQLTLEEVGAKLKLTRERIRQVQNAAVKKLRYSLRGLDLSDLNSENESSIQAHVW